MTVSDSVSATCPQMSRQQELVSRILMSTNRVFQGVSSRSQTNPESYTTLTEHPRRGMRIQASLEEKWKTEPTNHTKSSLGFKGNSAFIESTIYRSSSEHTKSTDSNFVTDNGIKSPLKVDEVFTQPILRSIGRRSSSIVRTLPTSAPTLCDSPVKLRIL